MAQTLCTIRRPFIWYQELIACASLKGNWDDSQSAQAADDSEWSSTDPEMSDND